MKSFIKKRIREQIIDGQNMNKSTQAICNKMTINSYEEALHYVEEALKGIEEPKKSIILHKIHAPLENLKHEQIVIHSQKKENGMTGDSIPDEADTYWSQIQSKICEQGSDFK